MTPDQRNEMIAGMVSRLAERLKVEGGDVAGWLRLVRAYVVLGDRDKAARDEGWSRQAMNHIAEMMPPQLRGPYALLPAPSESGEEK